MIDFDRAAKEAALDDTQNCGEYQHLCEKWFLRGATFGRKHLFEAVLEELRGCGNETPPGVRFAAQDIADWLERRMKEREDGMG